MQLSKQNNVRNVYLIRLELTFLILFKYCVYSLFSIFKQVTIKHPWTLLCTLRFQIFRWSINKLFIFTFSIYFKDNNKNVMYRKNINKFICIKYNIAAQIKLHKQTKD